MAQLPTAAKTTRRKKAAEATPSEEGTVGVVAKTMREAKTQMDEGKKAYDKARKAFLDLMGDSKKLEDEGYVYTVTVPVVTTFDAEGMVTDHPEASFLVTETVTTTYALNEEAAQEAIEQDTEGVVLALIQEYVSETDGSPRVNIKEAKTDG